MKHPGRWCCASCTFVAIAVICLVCGLALIAKYPDVGKVMGAIGFTCGAIGVFICLAVCLGDPPGDDTESETTI